MKHLKSCRLGSLSPDLSWLRSVMVLLGKSLWSMSDNFSNALLLTMTWCRASVNSCFPKWHHMAVAGIAGKKRPTGDLMLSSLLSPQFFYNPEAKNLPLRRHWISQQCVHRSLRKQLFQTLKEVFAFQVDEVVFRSLID